MRALTFDLEIIPCGADAIERHSSLDAGEAEAIVRARVGEACHVLATQRSGAQLYDDFYIWLAGGRALLRIDQHREWFATDPAWAASAAEGEMEFRDDNGASFSVPIAETVSPAQALDALAQWLHTGEMLASLAWR